MFSKLILITFTGCLISLFLMRSDCKLLIAEQNMERSVYLGLSGYMRVWENIELRFLMWKGAMNLGMKLESVRHSTWYLCA